MTPRSVLIVDDSLTVRMGLADAFAAAGYQTQVCTTLAEAREHLRHDPPGAVILDVLLPDGDGVELLAEIRAAGSDQLVVMLSTESEVGDRIRGLTTGADEYVGKPFDWSQVVSKVEELLRGRPGAADTARILVIDDSHTYRSWLREVLQAAGYTVVETDSGEDGLRAAAMRRPGAILVDGVLPGMDGAAVIRNLRLDAALRDIPCLLLTGSEDSVSELRALDAGADAFVRKGEDDADVVVARLAALLRRSHLRIGAAAETRSLTGFQRILAIDDSATYLDSLGDALRTEGFDVIPARSGDEGLAMLAVQPVDCILLDLLMPGLSGRQTCERIKAAPGLRDIPLVMLTALEDRDAMIGGLGAGADDFISKTADFAVLVARVRAQLRRKQFEDEHRRIRDELLRSELAAAEARAAREHAEARAALVDELEQKNRELEAFSYSVSHDLRAPLRAIDGFSRIALDECADALDARGRDCLDRVRRAALRMSALIDDLLALSRVGRAPISRSPVNLAALAREVIADLQRASPRTVLVVMPDALPAIGDPGLLRVLLDNLLGNSWKFAAAATEPRIELGLVPGSGDRTFFVRDNGAGFDMAYAAKLFRPFQRLHSESEFPGTGIGLATVHRIVERHGGRIWAEGAVRDGATFYFTLPEPR
jgi:DNA-binding response OmpR family regulator